MSAETPRPFEPCRCERTCGDDGDDDGPGTCKGLPQPPKRPLVEVVLVPRMHRLEGCA